MLPEQEVGLGVMGHTYCCHQRSTQHTGKPLARRTGFFECPPPPPCLPLGCPPLPLGSHQLEALSCWALALVSSRWGGGCSQRGAN